MTATDQLELIKPGKTYPSYVEITELLDGETCTVKFNLQSYVCGMYCAIYFPGQTIPHQCGDHNNMSFVRKLKKDIARAIERGADVIIGSIQDIKV